MDRKHSGVEYSAKKRMYICPECKYEAKRLTMIDAHRVEKHGIKLGSKVMQRIMVKIL